MARANATLEVEQVSRISVGGQLHSEWTIAVDGKLAGWVHGLPSTATGLREYIAILWDSERERRVYLPLSYSSHWGNVRAVAAILDRS